MDKHEKRNLAGKAHSLKPVVSIGNKGLSEAVIKEVHIALDAHELIKIKIMASDKAERLEISERIVAQTQSEFLNLIGQVGIFYRKNTQ
jgi:RNA-binding protein